MHTAEMAATLTTLFSELVDGATNPGGAYMLNSGDAGLVASLDKLAAQEASLAVHGGATIAAHAQHVRYGLSLMNRWARDGGNPFAGATWEEAWKTSAVDAAAWAEIRNGLRAETRDWLTALQTPRAVSSAELAGMIGSIAHLAYHLGAIRQISRQARGPREGMEKS